MAVTTVSSLTESFTSDVPVLLGDEVMDKGKEDAGQNGNMVAEEKNQGESGSAREPLEVSSGKVEESELEGDEDEIGVLQMV